MSQSEMSRDGLEPVEPIDPVEPVEPVVPSGPELRPYSDVEYHFLPHAASMPPARKYIQDVWDRRQFAMSLAKAELRGPRASTLLGEVWAVLDPLFQAAIYFFLITVIRGSSTSSQPGGQSRYLTMMVSGIFLFTFTTVAIGEGGRSIMRNKGLMLNSTFPRALLPAAAVYKGFLSFLPSVAIYAVLHLVLRAPFGPGLLLLPLLFVLQLMVSTGLALLFSVLTVFIRDMSNMLDYIMRILLFVTPVIYPVSLLTPTMQFFLQLNPLFALFASYQAVITGGMPSFGNILIATFWAVSLLVVGFRVFASNERGFALRL